MTTQKKHQYVYPRDNNHWQIRIKGKCYGTFSSLEEALLNRNMILETPELKINDYTNRKRKRIIEEIPEDLVNELFNKLENLQKEMKISEIKIQENLEKISNLKIKEETLLFNINELEVKRQNLISILNFE